LQESSRNCALFPQPTVGKAGDRFRFLEPAFLVQTAETIAAPGWERGAQGLRGADVTFQDTANGCPG